MPDPGQNNCSSDSTAGCGNSTSGADPVNLYTGQFFQQAFLHREIQDTEYVYRAVDGKYFDKMRSLFRKFAYNFGDIGYI